MSLAVLNSAIPAGSICAVIDTVVVGVGTVGGSEAETHFAPPTESKAGNKTEAAAAFVRETHNPVILLTGSDYDGSFPVRVGTDQEHQVPTTVPAL